MWGVTTSLCKESVPWNWNWKNQCLWASSAGQRLYFRALTTLWPLAPRSARVGSITCKDSLGCDSTSIPRNQFLWILMCCKSDLKKLCVLGAVAAEFDLGLSPTSKRIMSISLGSGMFFTIPLTLHKHKILPSFMLGLVRAQSYFGDNNVSTLATWLMLFPHASPWWPNMSMTSWACRLDSDPSRRRVHVKFVKRTHMGFSGPLFFYVFLMFIVF